MLGREESVSRLQQAPDENRERERGEGKSNVSWQLGLEGAE